jgi:AAA15 family ATPase/GTPase
MFRNLGLKNFPPFVDQTIHFPESGAKGEGEETLAKTHILTGVNGTGKTRLLSVLAAVLGNPEHLTKRMAGASPEAEIRVNMNNLATTLPPLTPDVLANYMLRGGTWNI